MKPGSTPEPKTYAPKRPVLRVERTYHRDKKQEVLLFLAHHRVFVDRSAGSRPDYYRLANQSEAAAYFKIPKRTISNWVKQSKCIFGDLMVEGTSESISEGVLEPTDDDTVRSTSKSTGKITVEDTIKITVGSTGESTGASSVPSAERVP